jgi:CBS domain-containing protein
MTVGEVCNREVVVAHPHASIVDAARLMKTHHVGDVIVVEEGASRRVPVGILTDRDVALAVVDRFTRLAYLRVHEIMTHDVVTAREDENLFLVVKRMQANGIRRLPIVNAAGGLEGILTFDDVIALLSEQLNDLARLVAAEQKRERFHAAPAPASVDMRSMTRV